MNILLLSLGGGGGNILRSVKALYQRDLIVAEATDPVYADRLKQSVATRFVDTNRFSLVDIPMEERLLIGPTTTQHLGARHDPAVARCAFDESKRDIEELINRYSALIVIATGGKGTGAGTIVPVTMLARQQKKLVIPIFIRPSFERHEVEKHRFDQALAVSRQLDDAKIRFIEILNDRGYVEADPQPQSVVWERMNVPIARALRGLLYVLWDLSQVDPSDLSALFAGQGRLRLGFSELDPASGDDPRDEDVDNAVRRCWGNEYCNFSEPVGTSLVCIQGSWSNVADAKIKSRLAAQAVNTGSTAYNPLYARAFQMPKPWGITALLAEYTGNHPPIDIEWPLDAQPTVTTDSSPDAVVGGENVPAPPSVAASALSATQPCRPTENAIAPNPVVFGTFWDLALALNRSDGAALVIARNGADGNVAVNLNDLKKLLGTVWFRAVFALLSQAWRDRLLDTLVEGVVVPDHALRVGRRDVRLSDVNHVELKDLFSRSSINEAARGDVRFLVAVGNLWGAESLKRIRFVESPVRYQSSRFSGILQGF